MQAHSTKQKHRSPVIQNARNGIQIPTKWIKQYPCILKLGIAICTVFLCGCQTVKFEKSEPDSESATVNLIIWEF